MQIWYQTMSAHLSEVQNRIECIFEETCCQEYPLETYKSVTAPTPHISSAEVGKTCTQRVFILSKFC